MSLVVGMLLYGCECDKNTYVQIIRLSDVSDEPQDWWIVVNAVMYA